ncbi:uncharacterized protein LOC141614548 [Silene latifolia]|uniref:uncharacterized protein LOC141614548 n=1 Tax=Silene latifolia TaxID=37657 RepID=UPI003D78B24C
MYFGGVAPSIKHLILNSTGYTEGELPVRYLGIPLFCSRLTQRMFSPLLDKIRGNLGHWANHMLSYAGKIALIKSVIFGLQNFWGSSVLLPKGIVKKIHKMCKDFLWGIKDGARRLVFKSWNSFCLPRTEGGVDIKEILSWNKTQLMMWLHKLLIASPNIWVNWVKAYVLKGISIWDFKMTAAYSWFWGNVISSRDSLLQLVGERAQAEALLLEDGYKQKIYDLIRSKGTPFSYHKTIWDSVVYPKHAIIGLLASQNKLPTIDNLCTRGLVLVNRCTLCERQAETGAHLFFNSSIPGGLDKEFRFGLSVPVALNWTLFFRG